MPTAMTLDPGFAADPLPHPETGKYHVDEVHNAPPLAVLRIFAARQDSQECHQCLLKRRPSILNPQQPPNQMVTLADEAARQFKYTTPGNTTRHAAFPFNFPQIPPSRKSHTRLNVGVGQKTRTNTISSPSTPVLDPEVPRMHAACVRIQRNAHVACTRIYVYLW